MSEKREKRKKTIKQKQKHHEPSAGTTRSFKSRCKAPAGSTFERHSGGGRLAAVSEPGQLPSDEITPREPAREPTRADVLERIQNDIFARRGAPLPPPPPAPGRLPLVACTAAVYTAERRVPAARSPVPPIGLAPGSALAFAPHLCSSPGGCGPPQQYEQTTPRSALHACCRW